MQSYLSRKNHWLENLLILCSAKKKFWFWEIFKILENSDSKYIHIFVTEFYQYCQLKYQLKVFYKNWYWIGTEIAKQNFAQRSYLHPFPHGMGNYTFPHRQRTVSKIKGGFLTFLPFLTKLSLQLEFCGLHTNFWFLGNS